MAADPGFWNGRRVFVTGLSGFKGSWLALWLCAMGAETIGFAARHPNGPSLYDLARLDELVELVTGDVRDLDSVHAALEHAKPEVVLHLAGQPIVRRAFADPIETYSTNVMGTVHVLEAVRQSATVRALVNVTTDRVYSNGTSEWARREPEPLGGDDPYSSSKACSEFATAAYRDSFLHDRVRVASARSGNVIGGGDWGRDRLVPDAMRAALDGRPLVVRNPNAIREWQHVLCPLEGYLTLVERMWESDEFAGAFNFGPPEQEALPVGQIVDRLGELWPGGITREGPTESDAPPEAPTLKLDSTRARERLGWDPRWDLDRALQAVVAWYVAYRDAEDMRAVTLEQIAEFTKEA